MNASRDPFENFVRRPHTFKLVMRTCFASEFSTVPANSYLHSNRPDDFIRSSVHPILVRSSGVSTACFVPSFSRQIIFPSIDHTLWTLDVSALISLINKRSSNHDPNHVLDRVLKRLSERDSSPCKHTL